jgi:hypothetical protein
VGFLMAKESYKNLNKAQDSSEAVPAFFVL